MTVFQLVLYIIMILLSLYTAYTFTIRRAKHINESALIFKVIASICFVLLGFVAFWGSKGVSSTIILPGLIMGLIGDIFLDMKFVYPESDDLYTTVGFASFFIGHIFYLLFLIFQYGLLGTGMIISIIIGIIAGAAIYLTQDLMHLQYGKFRTVSAVYGGLLILVTVYAAFICFVHFSTARFLFLLGILLFLISDLILSQIYFGQDKNTPGNSILNHSTYYLGQILIAASIFLI